jgi:(E)-4-hydroxy-3-methylbut-2-enyl-diphosphate synthase
MSFNVKIKRRVTRSVVVGSVAIGSDHPISVQSMCATKTRDIAKTLDQIRLLEAHGADFIRIAIDSKRDIEALAQLRKETNANLVVDLQENYRLAEVVAPLVNKIRYNPGHLHHHEPGRSVADKVKYLVEVAGQHGCAMRIGVNFGSLDRGVSADSEGSQETALRSVDQHVNLMERFAFKNFVVSLKSSNPNDVIAINKSFAVNYPDIPLHLGVTEAGLLPMGEVKTRIAFENLLALGIGDTVRVSLTLPFEDKYKEILIGRQIIEDVYNGRFRSVPRFEQEGLNIISCPSCSRVENEAFVNLAEQVRESTEFVRDHNITIAVMGCRVNGPGETDEADLGLWCAPKHVNLKRGEETVGAFSYEEIIPRLLVEVESLIANRRKVGITL